MATTISMDEAFLWFEFIGTVVTKYININLKFGKKSRVSQAPKSWSSSSSDSFSTLQF